MRIKFGIRDTATAVEQSELVLAPIRQAFPNASVELVTMDAAGHHLYQTGDLEQALWEGRVDFVIHPLELLPPTLSDDLPLVAFTRRSTPKYALVLAEHTKKLPKAKPIGCFTALQAIQLRDQYPKHEIKLLTEQPLACLRLFHTAAIGGLVLSSPQIAALDLTDRVYHWFTAQELVPAAGTGILAVQARRGTDCSCLKPVNDLDTAYCALAERAFLRKAQGDPGLTGAYARTDGSQLVLTGVTTAGGQALQEGDIFGNPQQAAVLGEMLAAHLG